MKLQTRVFELCNGRYANLAELAQAMGISVSQIYRVRQGKRPVSEKFITGAAKAFPEYSMDQLFYISHNKLGNRKEGLKDNLVKSLVSLGS